MKFISTQADEKSICDLVDTYLAALYPNYFESTRAVLLGQARDLLKNEFHADLSRFEREFLSPAAELIRIIKNVSHNLVVSVFFFCLTFTKTYFRTNRSNICVHVHISNGFEF